MGDPDLRVRWRAAHALRRLARLNADETLYAFVAEYGRREESLFRSPNFDFYWIAARLWFVVACARIASEAPPIAAIAAQTLLKIAHDQDFPHLIIQAFARDACQELLRTGHLVLTPTEMAQLDGVAQSQLAPAEAPEGRPFGRLGFARDEGRRFHFDIMDSVPYWYDPMLEAFANVSQDQLLTTAEGWIVDRWHYAGDERRTFAIDQRRHRISDRDWTLTNNRHGSHPTIERLNNHLEWHALWCAAGELLRTEPLRAGADRWCALEPRIARAMLTEPPLWSTDLRGPTPLRPDFWIEPKETQKEWVACVQEERLRGEIQALDCPGYILVSGDWGVRTCDREESIRYHSALVKPALAPSLVRTLQTMETVWDYYIPSEPEDNESDMDESPYKMVPWLRNLSSDGGIDHSDPLRGTANLTDWQPGRLVCDACGIQRDRSGGPVWSRPGRRPMFIYEVWGDEGRDNNRSYFATSGRRLLVDSAQLQEFLAETEFELVIKVEIRREEGGNQRSFEPETESAKGYYDRIYRLDRSGGLFAAEGCVGTWYDDSTTT